MEPDIKAVIMLTYKTFDDDNSFAVFITYTTTSKTNGIFGNNKLICFAISSAWTEGISDIVENKSIESGIAEIIIKNDVLAANIGKSLYKYNLNVLTMIFNTFLIGLGKFDVMFILFFFKLLRKSKCFSCYHQFFVSRN